MSVAVGGAYAEVVAAETIAARVAELGAEISRDYAGKEPIAVGVMHGSLIFLADLVREITIDMHVDFLALSPFGQGGRVRIALDTVRSLENRHVLIVEDIVDTGLTMSFLRDLLSARQVASLAAVALLDKAPRRIVETPIEYRGFEVGEEFLLGYGLDWEGLYRNVPSLWAVNDFVNFQKHPDSFGQAVFGPASDRLSS